MKTPVANADILNVMKAHCSSTVVDSVLTDLRKVNGYEERVLGSRESGDKPGGSLLEALSDHAKLDQLITLWQSRLPEEDVSEMLIGIGDVFKLHGDFGKAEEFYSLVHARGCALGQKRYVAEGLMRRGEILSRLGRWKESSADLAESRSLFARLKEPASVGRVENILGTSCAEQGKIKQAQRYFGRALNVFERAAEPDMTGTVLMNIGIVYSITGQWDKALVQYKRAQSYFEDLGDVNRLAELHHNMGMGFLQKGMHKEAIGEFETAFTLSTKSRLVNLMGLACLGKADAHARMGDYPVALKLVNQSIGYFSFTNERLNIADAYKIKGMIHREMKNFAFADTYLKTSLRMNIELNNQLNIAETCVELGNLARVQNKADEALRSFEQASVFYRKIGAEYAANELRASIEALKEQAE